MMQLRIQTTATASLLVLMLVTLQFSACNGQVREKSANEQDINTQPVAMRQNTLFPQIHTNLNGMVREFVRSMHHDQKGNYWFGTNTDGIIRYDGQTLEKIALPGSHQSVSVREIVEDKAGNVWFGTSDGLFQYDGETFTVFSEKEGLPDAEIWGLAIDKNGLIWVGTLAGVCQFDGQTCTPFPLPDEVVENPQYMLSDKLVKKFVEDKDGMMWLLTDGNGIFKYKNGAFTHLTDQNGLTDNNTADILADKAGNMWIGTFYGGVSMFDGKTYTNFTKDGLIEGIETYNFIEDRQGNIWFSAENHGVYKYDGATFTPFTTEDGLTTNGVQSIMEDNKGQLWFGTWQGISLYDGQRFMNANEKEGWMR